MEDKDYNLYTHMYATHSDVVHNEYFMPSFPSFSAGSMSLLSRILPNQPPAIFSIPTVTGSTNGEPVRSLLCFVTCS